MEKARSDIFFGQPWSETRTTIAIFAVSIHKNSGKQRKNSGRFCCYFASDRTQAQDFCGEPVIPRCKFPGKTAKTARTVIRAGSSLQAPAGQTGPL
jgi:hypothetical protein